MPEITAKLKEYLKKLRTFLVTAWTTIYVVYLEKGIGFFKLPLLAGAAAVVVLYYLVYASITNVQKNKIGEIEANKAVLNFAETYRGYQTTLRKYQTKLPSMKEKDTWLLNTLTDACLQENILLDKIGTQSEVTVEDFMVATLDFEGSMYYKKAGQLAAHLENSKKFIKLAEFKIERNEMTRGPYTVKGKIATVFSKYR